MAHLPPGRLDGPTHWPIIVGVGGLVTCRTHLAVVWLAIVVLAPGAYARQDSSGEPRRHSGNS